MSIPTIHLNGSSGERLLNDTEAALRAVRKAIVAVAAAAPNARDFYVQGESAYRNAAAAHADRLRRLCGVRDEINTIYIGIHDQLDRKR